MENKKLKAKIANAKYYKTNKGRHTVKRVRDKRRRFIWDFFGGECVHCGFTDGRALQMDHINGRNGAKRLGNLDQRFAYIRKNPDEARKIFQLLCANCNFIKREENQEWSICNRYDH